MLSGSWAGASEARLPRRGLRGLWPPRRILLGCFPYAERMDKQEVLPGRGQPACGRGSQDYRQAAGPDCAVRAHGD
jgi:hypothetical protein